MTRVGIGTRNLLCNLFADLFGSDLVWSLIVSMSVYRLCIIGFDGLQTT